MEYGNAGQRLVTQNLIANAVVYETGATVNQHSVRDLVVLVDTLCLCDSLIVLGRQTYDFLKKSNSELLSAIQPYVRVSEPSESAVSAAAAHLTAFLGSGAERQRYAPLFKAILNPSFIEKTLSANPDELHSFQIGNQWLTKLPKNANIVARLEDGSAPIHRAATFFARTFLYLGVMDVQQLAFTPDSTRVKAYGSVVVAERKLRQRLADRLAEAFRKGASGEELHLARVISPLAAVVFDRASNRREIVRELVQLRHELEPFRSRLRDVEHQLFFASRKNEQRIIVKWNKVFAELEREYGPGAGDGSVTVNGLLSLSEAAAQVIDKPKDVASYAKALKIPADAISRMLSRRRAIELYRLSNQLPGSSNLVRTAHRLFGDSLIR
jgi:hypothetical protein